MALGLIDEEVGGFLVASATGSAAGFGLLEDEVGVFLLASSCLTQSNTDVVVPSCEAD